MNTADPPCDFDAFVAQRRGISYEEAEQLVQSWLAQYSPRIVTTTSSGPAQHQSAIPDLPIATQVTADQDCAPQRGPFNGRQPCHS